MRCHAVSPPPRPPSPPPPPPPPPHALEEPWLIELRALLRRLQTVQDITATPRQHTVQSALQASAGPIAEAVRFAASATLQRAMRCHFARKRCHVTRLLQRLSRSVQLLAAYAQRTAALGREASEPHATLQSEEAH
eukprot:2891771-Rhodomonas_salina.1